MGNFMFCALKINAVCIGLNDSYLIRKNKKSPRRHRIMRGATYQQTFRPIKFNNSIRFFRRSLYLS